MKMSRLSSSFHCEGVFCEWHERKCSQCELEVSAQLPQSRCIPSCLVPCCETTFETMRMFEAMEIFEDESLLLAFTGGWSRGSALPCHSPPVCAALSLLSCLSWVCILVTLLVLRCRALPAVPGALGSMNKTHPQVQSFRKTLHTFPEVNVFLTGLFA